MMDVNKLLYTNQSPYLLFIMTSCSAFACADMNKRTIPEGSHRSAPKRFIVDDAAAKPDAEATAAWAEALRPEMDRFSLPEWVYRGRRYGQLQCRMRHAPGTCKNCAIVIE